MDRASAFESVSLRVDFQSDQTNGLGLSKVVSPLLSKPGGLTLCLTFSSKGMARSKPFSCVNSINVHMNKQLKK